MSLTTVLLSVVGSLVGIVLVLFLGGLLLLRLCASRISPDQAYIGHICKTAYIYGIHLPQVHASMFQFFPAACAANPDDKTTNVLKDPDAIRAFVSDPARRSRRGLVVALAGGAVRGIGTLRTEFRRTLQTRGSVTSECDLLFLLDPSGMSFYSSCFSRVHGVLGSVLAHYRSAVMVGNCMGATGALYLSSAAPPSCSTTVLSFNPVIDPPTDMRRGMRLSAWFVKGVHQLQDRLMSRLGSIMQGPLRVAVHHSQWPAELDQVLKLGPVVDAVVSVASDQSGVSMKDAFATARRVIRVSHPATHHGLVRSLRAARLLSGVLDQALLSSEDYWDRTPLEASS